MMHNLIDGLIIGAAYLASTPMGIATTIAVGFHELPQEIGDFAILVQGGLSKRKALLFNFLTALTSIVGAGIALVFGSHVFMFIDALLPLTAGGFIYIAGSDLIPLLHRQEEPLKSVGQIIFIILGVGIMVVLKMIFQ